MGGAASSSNTQKQVVALDKEFSLMKKDVQRMQDELARSEEIWKVKAQADEQKINMLERKVQSARITAKKARREAKKATRAGGGGAGGAYAVSTKSVQIEEEEEEEVGYEDEEEEKHPATGMGEDDMFSGVEAEEGVQFAAVKPWIGAIVEPSNPPTVDKSPPSEALVIDWVHGYRCHDSRSNLVYNSKGEIVYPTAALVITYNPELRTQRYYTGHNDDVTCLTQNNNEPDIVATGQVATIVNGKKQFPHICIHNTVTGEEWKIKKAGEEKIKQLAFSPCGQYLASADATDMTIWDWKTAKKLASAQCTPNQIRWNRVKPTEICTVGVRMAWFWNFENNKLSKPKKVTGCSDKKFLCVAFSDKGIACAGGADGKLYVFIGAAIKKTIEGIHTKPTAALLSLEPCDGGLISAGADGSVVLVSNSLKPGKKWQFPSKVISIKVLNDKLLVGCGKSQVYSVPDFRNKDSLDGLEPHIEGHFDGELWGCAVDPSGSGEYCTAGEDNKLIIWDVKAQKKVRETVINPKRGPRAKKKGGASTMSSHPPNQCARSVDYSPDGKHIAIGTNSGEVTVFDAKTMEVIVTKDLNKLGKRKVFGQTGNWIEMLKYSPSGKTLAVATHGIVIVLLSVESDYKPKKKLTSHAASVTGLDWSKDCKHIRSVCMAYELLFFDVDEANLKGAKQNTSAKALRDVEWTSQCTKFGWHVDGIFAREDGSEITDGSQINSVAVNDTRSLCITGDDEGNVNLFRYPVQKGGQLKAFPGHSSHITRVHFALDDKYVLSAGGGDKSVFQWRLA